MGDEHLKALPRQHRFGIVIYQLLTAMIFSSSFSAALAFSRRTTASSYLCG